MTIDTFSFRYADTAGFMEWFRYNFCKLDLCMCSGNSWTIHVTYRESRDEYIHAMGHSEAPDGFAEGKRAIEAFFERYL